MNKIIYNIIKSTDEGDERSTFKLDVPHDLFKLLTLFGVGLYQTRSFELVGNQLSGMISGLDERYIEIQYDILYHFLENQLGIEFSDIDELFIEDYNENELVIDVYLN